MKRVYKLFRLRKDGTLGPLFIDARLRVPVGVELPARDVPTKGFAHRPGWHSGVMPIAPHLSEKGRVWAECSIPDHADWYEFKRPGNQGGKWIISDCIVVDRILTTKQVERIRSRCTACAA